MRVILTTLGSTGDVRPVLALALRLRAAGHITRVCTLPFFAEECESLGLDFVPVGPDYSETEWRRLFAELDDCLLPSSVMELLVERLFLGGGRAHFETALAAMQGFDLAVCHHIDYFGQEAAIQAGVPWIGLTYCPALIPTPLNPPLHYPYFGRMLNRAFWAAGELATFRATCRARAALREMGSARHDFRPNYSFSPLLNFVPVSPVVGKLPEDLPPEFQVTGPWMIAENTPPLDPELEAFMQTPPLVITFGSMAGQNGEQTARLLLEAVVAAGERAVIQRGFGDIGCDSPPESVRFIEFAAHERLFARAKAVIHHGGAGTTHAACRAGVPSFAVPHIADQPYWGKQLQRLGVGPGPIARKSLTPRRLEQKIRQLVENPLHFENAKRIGTAMRGEDGTGKAVEILEHLHRNRPTTTVTAGAA